MIGSFQGPMLYVGSRIGDCNPHRRKNKYTYYIITQKALLVNPSYAGRISKSDLILRNKKRKPLHFCRGRFMLLFLVSCEYLVNRQHIVVGYLTNVKESFNLFKLSCVIYAVTVRAVSKLTSTFLSY